MLSFFAGVDLQNIFTTFSYIYGRCNYTQSQRIWWFIVIITTSTISITSPIQLDIFYDTHLAKAEGNDVSHFKRACVEKKKSSQQVTR